MRKNDLKLFQAKFSSNSTHLKGLGVDGGLDDVHHHLRWDRVGLQVEGADGFVWLGNATVIFQTQYPPCSCYDIHLETIAEQVADRVGEVAVGRRERLHVRVFRQRLEQQPIWEKGQGRSKLATRTSLVFYRILAYIVTLGWRVWGTFEKVFSWFNGASSTVPALLPRGSGVHIQQWFTKFKMEIESFRKW